MRPDHFSCVHFLSYDNDVHTPLQFCDPLSGTRFLSPSLSRDYVSEYVDLDISEGDFLMFPCYLQHRVKPQKVIIFPESADIIGWIWRKGEMLSVSPQRKNLLTNMSLFFVICMYIKGKVICISNVSVLCISPYTR